MRAAVALVLALAALVRDLRGLVQAELVVVHVRRLLAVWAVVLPVAPLAFLADAPYVSHAVYPRVVRLILPPFAA